MKPSSSEDSAPWTALAAFLTDETSGTRSVTGETFREWLESGNQNAPMASAIQHAWEQPGTPHMVSVDTSAALRSVSERAGIASTGSLGIARSSGRVSTRVVTRRWIPYAGAAVAAAAGLALLLKPVMTPSPPGDDAVQVFRTSNSQRASMQLSDGSTVVLGPATSVEVRGRQLSLRGQASFHVTQNHQTPFTVATHGVLTTVLGTEFAIRAYDAQTSVAVRAGKVSMNSTVLAEGQRGTMTNAGEIRIERGQAVSDAFAFTEGKLILRNVTLAEAVPELNRWFDAEIRLGDPSVGAKLIETTLGSGSRNDLAAMLEFILRVRVEQNGRILTLWAQ